MNTVEGETVQYFPNLAIESFFTDHLMRLFSRTCCGKVYLFFPLSQLGVLSFK